MLLPYLLAFCRIAIGITFACSFLAKVRDVGQFAQTITNFKLLPSRWSRPMALLFLMGELAVVVLALMGRSFLAGAFGLALLLLVAFTADLASILARNIHTVYNCFGSSERLIAYADLWRNAGFVLVAAAATGTAAGQCANLFGLSDAFRSNCHDC